MKMFPPPQIDDTRLIIILLLMTNMEFVNLVNPRYIAVFVRMCL